MNASDDLAAQAATLPPEPAVRALAALCRLRDAPARVRADLPGFLAEHGVEGDDLAQLCRVGAKRLLVYRALVQNRLRNAARGLMPRTAARLGDARFRADFDTFMDEQAPRSPYLRDVPGEFVQWVTPRWVADDEVPGYLPELARHELLGYAIANDPGGGEPHTGRPLALDRPLRVDGSARLVRYAHALHRLPTDPTSTQAPERVPTPLLAYRDRDTLRARYLLLSPFGEQVLGNLLERRLPVAEALQRACDTLDEPLDDAHLATAAELFADLEQRQVLLGAD